MSLRTKLSTVVPLVALMALLAGPRAGAVTQLPAWGTVPSQNRGDLANDLSGVSVIGPEDIWAVGEYNPGVPPTVTGRRTLTEHWDGTAFRIVKSPNETFSGVDATYLKDVDAVASNDVWAVGFGEDFGSLRLRTLTIHWDGARWTKIPSPDPAGRDLPNELFAVRAIAPDDVVAVGATGYPEKSLILRWDGSTWNQMPSGCGVELQGVDARSATDIWAVGSSTTCHFDGSRWRVVPSPQPRGQYNEVAYSLQDVSIRAADDVWASGSRTIEQGEYSVTASLVEHWDGSSWTAMYAVPGQTLNGIDPLGPGDVYAVGTDGTYPIVAHYDGTAWTEVPSPTEGGGELRRIDGEAGTSALWAAGHSYAGGSPRTLVEQAPSATQGTVVGDTTVAGATVTWIGPEDGSTETNVFGDYAAAGLTAGTYTFIASYAGCEPVSSKVTVVAGQVSTQDLDINC